MRLGRFPFSAAIKHYMDRRYGLVGETTMKEEGKKLRYLAKVFEELKTRAAREDAAHGTAERPRAFTTDPRHLGRREIQAFLAWMRERRLDPVTQAKYLQTVKNFLKAFKNHVIADMIADGVRFPKVPKKPIRTLDVQDLQAIFEAAQGLRGWYGSVARGMIALYFASGVRPSELRLAHLEDLNLRKGTLRVRHPKGEGAWASQEEVTLIREDVLPIVEQYLNERQQHVRKRGRSKAVALFPNLYQGRDGFYSANAFKKIKRRVEVASGVSFMLKDFRPTLTSITVNGDMSLLPAMSAQLRHTNLATTQRSYYRIQQGVAGKQLKDAWKSNPLHLSQYPAIENSKKVAG